MHPQSLPLGPRDFDCDKVDLGPGFVGSRRTGGAIVVGRAVGVLVHRVSDRVGVEGAPCCTDGPGDRWRRPGCILEDPVGGNPQARQGGARARTDGGIPQATPSLPPRRRTGGSARPPVPCRPPGQLCRQADGSRSAGMYSPRRVATCLGDRVDGKDAPRSTSRRARLVLVGRREHQLHRQGRPPGLAYAAGRPAVGGGESARAVAWAQPKSESLTSPCMLVNGSRAQSRVDDPRWLRLVAAHDGSPMSMISALNSASVMRAAWDGIESPLSLHPVEHAGEVGTVDALHGDDVAAALPLPGPRSARCLRGSAGRWSLPRRPAGRPGRDGAQLQSHTLQRKGPPVTDAFRSGLGQDLRPVSRPRCAR